MNYLILISLLLVLFGSRFYYITKNKTKFNSKELFILLFLFYLLVFIKIILLNDEEFTLSLKSMIKQAQLMPSFKIIDEYTQSMKKIFITVPFGFFISAILSTNLNYKKLFQYGFSISLVIETLNLFKLNAIWSMDNILLITAGFLIGGFIYQIGYKLLKIVNKQTWLDKLKEPNSEPFKKTWNLMCSLIIIYILGIYSSLIYHTYPLSVLDKAKIIQIDDFKIEIEEKLSQLTINGYYQTNFNRLKRLYSTKIDLDNEPIYNVYTLIEPYKPQTDINYGILVVGWTDQPLTVDINYKDVSSVTKVHPGLFTLGYPHTVSEIPILDRHTRSAANLSITFYDESGNVIDIPYDKQTMDE